MISNLMLVGSVVVVLCIVSFLGFLRHRHQAEVVQLFGSALLLVMVLTHVAEHFRLLLTMHWGSSDSPGHYLDLTSAVGGVALLCGGFAMKLVNKFRRAG